MLEIARYNWPQYVAAGFVAGIAAAGWRRWQETLWFSRSALVACLWVTWWGFASLAASHWIYDLSALYRWDWLREMLPGGPGRWLNLHAGLDECSSALSLRFPDSRGTSADFFDADEMSEPSIHRARHQRANPIPALRVRARQLPFADRTFDTVFLVFAAHEIRDATASEVFLREVARVVSPAGAVLLVEHLRDAANFAAFGPGYFHFFTRREWRRRAGVAGLQLTRERRITPFVKVMLMKKAP
jgi:SAM-dependent methyltransferase